MSSPCSISWASLRPTCSASASAASSRTSALVHEFPGWNAEQLEALRAPTLLMFGDRDFSPLTDVAELFAMLPEAQLAVLPRTTHMGMTRRPREILALVTPFLDDGA